jgi:hypothetical protein
MISPRQEQRYSDAVNNSLSEHPAHGNHALALLID